MGLHKQLKREFPREYGALEKSLVGKILLGLRRVVHQWPSLCLSTSQGRMKPNKRGACWNQLIKMYCRIHACLKIELRAWNEKDFQEFGIALLNLRKATEEPPVIATASSTLSDRLISTASIGTLLQTLIAPRRACLRICKVPGCTSGPLPERLACYH